MNKKIFLIILLTLSSGQSSLLEKVKNTVRTHMLTKKEMISGFCLAPLTLYAGLKTKEHQKDQSNMKSLQKMYGWAVAGGLCNYAVYQNIEHLFKKIPLQKKKMLIASAAHSAFLLLYVFLSNNRPPNAPNNQNKDNQENNSIKTMEEVEDKDSSDNESIKENLLRKPNTEVNSSQALALELPNTNYQSKSKARYFSPYRILLISLLTIIELRLVEFIFKSSTSRLDKSLKMKMIKIFSKVLFCRILVFFDIILERFNLFTFIFFNKKKYKKNFQSEEESPMKELPN